MIDKILTNFTSNNSVEFVQDDDKEMEWISSFESSDYGKFLIFIDSNVEEIWGGAIMKQLNLHNKTIIVKRVKSVESTKSITFYSEAVDFLESNKCNRFDLVIAIGGGIVLDMVSFVVSTYMRGVPLFMIPTTLIGQTDASTAGKTCFNSNNNKNLLGTFYYPIKVYNNINFLYTNTNRFLRQGFSESFKYGLLNSKILIDQLNEYKVSNDKKILKKIINLTIESRIAIRQIDALASNLGHTFGHAIEKFSDYKVLHGDAISAGTIIALNYSVHIGVMTNKLKDDIIDNMKFLGLNLYIDENLDSKKIVELMLLDKKSSSTALNLVLIKGVSSPYSENGRFFCKSDPGKVETFLGNFLKTYEYKIENCSQYLERDVIDYNKKA